MYDLKTSSNSLQTVELFQTFLEQNNVTIIASKTEEAASYNPTLIRHIVFDLNLEGTDKIFQLGTRADGNGGLFFSLGDSYDGNYALLVGGLGFYVDGDDSPSAYPTDLLMIFKEGKHALLYLNKADGRDLPYTYLYSRATGLNILEGRVIPYAGPLPHKALESIDLAAYYVGIIDGYDPPELPEQPQDGYCRKRLTAFTLQTDYEEPNDNINLEGNLLGLWTPRVGPKPNYNEVIAGVWGWVDSEFVNSPCFRFDGLVATCSFDYTRLYQPVNFNGLEYVRLNLTIRYLNNPFYTCFLAEV